MKSSVKLRPTPWDAVVAAAIAAAAILLGVVLWGRAAAAPSGDLTAVISQNGQVLYEIDLSAMEEDHREITVTGSYTAVIALEHRRVCIQSSNCPTQDCVHTGWISKAGQCIVCLPNHLVVELVGGGDGGVDAVIG
jgi:hypothetical protein